MLKGAAKLVPHVLKQDKCKPVTIEMISRIKNTLDQTNPFDAAFFACLTTIFYTAARVGKFTTQRLDAFNPAEHITWEGVRDDIDHNGLHTKVFVLPCTKSLCRQGVALGKAGWTYRSIRCLRQTHHN